MVYVKIVETVEKPGVSSRHGERATTMVPTRSYLYDAKWVMYEKVFLEDRAAYDEAIKELDNATGGSTLIGAPVKKYPCEAAMLMMYREVGATGMLAIGARVFIMNERGDTIDRVMCATKVEPVKK